LQLGCHAFIAKPIKFDSFLNCLQTHLNLTWLHESEAITESPPDLTEPPAVQLTSAQLSELLELARQGDVMGIFSFAEELEQTDEKLAAFARYIHELASQFKISDIRKIAQKYLS
jgi:phage gp29-like protein